MQSAVPLRRKLRCPFGGVASHNSALRIIGKHAAHLEKGFTRWRSDVNPLLVKVEIRILYSSKLEKIGGDDGTASHIRLHPEGGEGQ